ncbi:MAG: FAD/NAD(P)-binding protein [Desulfohalobiaceae bacterium]|nr:FAD/NAD(P)-binding protein [Desulfohalobiaceae bacterium]
MSKPVPSADKAFPLDLVPMTVTKVEKETRGTYSLELDPGESGFPFFPGQFNMLYVFGNGEVPISISGDPGRPDILVHTVRAVGQVSRALCRLRPGDVLGVRGPFGSSWPVDACRERDILFVSGGLGLAPLRPAVQQVFNHHQDYGKIIFLYGARTPDRLLYTKELETWSGRMRVELAVGSAGPDWKGHVGIITDFIARMDCDPLKTKAMICSSESMMRSMVSELNLLGIPDREIHLTLERNMKCGLGLCGHCQLGPTFVCKNGPVYSYDQVRELLAKREL